MRRDLQAVLDALAEGRCGEAVALLADAEWDAFQNHARTAGEIGFARWRAENGDLAGAAAVVRALAGGRP